MMGERQTDQAALFYEFSLERHVPANHMLRAIDRFVDLEGVRTHLATFYSSTGRPSIDPELLIRMLIVGYCFGIRSERRLCEEVHLNLAYRWFCRFGLEGDVPDHSTFSKNRHGRFRDSDVLRHVFEIVVRRCMAERLVGGEAFAVDASLIKADATGSKASQQTTEPLSERDLDLVTFVHSPWAQLDCRPCLRRQLPVEPYQRTGARAAIELSSCDERQTITDNSGLGWPTGIDRKIAPSLDRGSDRGQPMRILSILVFASSASAQSLPSVDCNAVKNSMVPVELAYHSQNGTRTVVQAYRDKSGDYVVWSRQTPPSTHPNPPVFVTKATYVDGAIASAELSTTYVGKYSHRTAKYTPDGLPKNFDRRSDVTYKMHALTTAGDDTTEEKTSTISYKFKSEETTAVGSCVLQVIHGEIDATNDAARTSHTFQVYFPELRISATAVDAEPIVDSLSTVFSEIKPVN